MIDRRPWPHRAGLLAAVAALAGLDLLASCSSGGRGSGATVITTGVPASAVTTTVAIPPPTTTTTGGSSPSGTGSTGIPTTAGGPPVASTTQPPRGGTTTTLAAVVPAPGIVAGMVGLRACGAVPVSEQCAPQPVAAAITATRSDGQRGTGRSGADGRYSLSLPAGRYILDVVADAGSLLCPPTSVQVNSGATATVDISCTPQHPIP